MDMLTTILLYGGFGGLTLTAIATIAISTVLVVSGRRLRAKLEHEYGKRRR